MTGPLIADLWTEHAAALINELTTHPADRPASDPWYVGLHRRSAVGQSISFRSQVRRAVLDARRAEAAVAVLASVDTPESRTLYAALHRAGVLVDSGRVTT